MNVGARRAILVEHSLGHEIAHVGENSGVRRAVVEKASDAVHVALVVTERLERVHQFLDEGRVLRHRILRKRLREVPLDEGLLPLVESEGTALGAGVASETFRTTVPT